MLGGIAPILIFSFPPPILDKVFTSLAGIPLLSEIIPVGFPIPLYLDETLTGIYIDSETRAMDVDTDIIPQYDSLGKSTGAYTNQTGISNLVTINMLADRDSLFLAVLLGLNDMVFSRLIKTKYRISYINGSTSVFNGFLHSFTTSVNSNETILKITLQLQKPNENKPTPQNLYYAAPRADGAIPTRGST